MLNLYVFVLPEATVMLNLYVFVLPEATVTLNLYVFVLPEVTVMLFSYIFLYYQRRQLCYIPYILVFPEVMAMCIG